jgi:putative DNA-invertase from lambdoid prophage Rac
VNRWTHQTIQPRLAWRVLEGLESRLHSLILGRLRWFQRQPNLSESSEAADGLLIARTRVWVKNWREILIRAAAHCSLAKATERCYTHPTQANKRTVRQMATFGYARVSTSRQAEEGESLDVQQRVISGYAQMHGLTVDETFVERGVSGSTPLTDRPEGAALLAALKPGDVVITAKLDRMFRSALDALDVLDQLKKRGVALHMIDLGGDVTGNGISKLVFTILSAVAEAERDRIRERVATVKADQRQRGRYLGGRIPFGFTVGSDGALVPNEAQQVVITEMRALRAQGAPYRAIQDTIAVEHGHRLSLDALHRILHAAE